MAKAQQSEDVANLGRFKQIRMVVSFTAKRDKRFVPLVTGAVLIPLVVFGLLAWLVGPIYIFGVLAVLGAVLAFVIVLNLRSNKAMMAEAAGTPGAAVSIIENMRGDWRVTQAIASTTQFDMVHLVIGRPGVVLIGEGNPNRVRSLMGQEKRRLAKVIGNADMRDVIVGESEGEVPIAKLRTTLMRMPRTTSGKDVNALAVRLKALTSRPQMPKGAIPKSMRPQGVNFRAPRGR